MGMAVHARDLVLTRGGNRVLATSDLDLPAGSVTALIGPNGSGKSSLLDAIAGLLVPATGTLEVLGGDAHSARPRIAYVLQATRVNEALPLTVAEVVGMARYQGRGLVRRLTPEDRDRIDYAVESLGLGDLSRRHLHELSGGQRQRVLVAQGLAQDADLILLDEPLSGLDLTSSERILQSFRAEVDRGRTVVLATHDLGEAERAQHVVLLAGRVAAAGPPSEVITPTHLADAYGARVVRVGDDQVLFDEHAHPAPEHPESTGRSVGRQ